MKISKNKLFAGILLFGLTSISLVLLNVQFLYLRAIFSFIFLTTIPGLLIMLALKIRGIGFWEYLVYTVGLSVSFLMFGGLAVNWLLPWLHITDKPLSLMPLLLSFYIFLSILGTIAYKRNKQISLKVKLPKLSRLNKALFITPVIFPILSILGATTLNNGGPNYLTMTMLGGISAYVFLLVLFRNKLNENIYPWSILLISISLLLMYSLRSWHILGWDINQEYLVFTLANSAMHWSVNALNSAYNLCLSITVLPTILASFLNINNEYIYKLIFPILFSIVPLMLYLTAKRILNTGHAFLSATFFISQYWFMEQMPALARQEIALIFFTCILMLKFDDRLSQSNKNILSIIFGISIIMSHYSTAYVWITILIIYYSISHITKITKINDLKLYFSFKYIILMIVFAFLWESQLSTTPGNFSSFVTSTISGISKGLSADMVNGGIERITFQGTNINSVQNIAKNYQTMSQEYFKEGFDLYPKETYRDYMPVPVFSKNIINPAFDNTRMPILLLMKIIKLILTVILPVIGIIYFLRRYLFNLSKEKKSYLSYRNRHENIYILLLGLSTLPLIFIILLLPFVAIQYNSTRLYMQSLIVLSNFTIVGGMYLLLKVRIKRLSHVIMGILIVMFFTYQNGQIFQIIGGEPLLPLNNFGNEYKMYYTSKNEVASVYWLSTNYDKKYLIYADKLAGFKLSSHGLINNTLYDVLPSTIDKNAYVYASNTNVIYGNTYSSYENGLISYTFPEIFLQNNKNLIYSNKYSEIYK